MQRTRSSGPFESPCFALTCALTVWAGLLSDQPGAAFLDIGVSVSVGQAGIIDSSVQPNGPVDLAGVRKGGLPTGSTSGFRSPAARELT